MPLSYLHTLKLPRSLSSMTCQLVCVQTSTTRWSLEKERLVPFHFGWPLVQSTLCRLPLSHFGVVGPGSPAIRRHASNGMLRQSSWYIFSCLYNVRVHIISILFCFHLNVIITVPLYTIRYEEHLSDKNAKDNSNLRPHSHQKH